jgi:hypothetical protein
MKVGLGGDMTVSLGKARELAVSTTWVFLWFWLRPAAAGRAGWRGIRRPPGPRRAAS